MMNRVDRELLASSMKIMIRVATEMKKIRVVRDESEKKCDLSTSNNSMIINLLDMIS
jgi:hypothetical protein